MSHETPYGYDMKITVLFIGVLTDYVGAGQAVFELPDGSPAPDLIAAIGQRFKDNMSPNVWSDEKADFTGTVDLSFHGPSVTIGVRW